MFFVQAPYILSYAFRKKCYFDITDTHFCFIYNNRLSIILHIVLLSKFFFWEKLWRQIFKAYVTLNWITTNRLKTTARNYLFNCFRYRLLLGRINFHINFKIFCVTLYYYTSIMTLWNYWLFLETMTYQCHSKRRGYWEHILSSKFIFYFTICILFIVLKKY